MRKWFLPFLLTFLAQPILPELYSYASPIQKEKKQQPLQHEVTVTLKLVQVYVTDKKGNSVLDLNKEDFIVYDNGKNQEVTEFEKHILSLPLAKTEIQPEIIQENKIPPPVNSLTANSFFSLILPITIPKES